MNLKKGLKLNEVCGQSFIVPMGESNIDFSKIIALNESSLFLWKVMEKGDFTKESLVKALLDEYEVDEETAAKDIENLITKFEEEKLFA